ncbi:MAG: HAD-IIB family hydrolase [Gammaproteobacteria bacterium]|nr:HAD-IIB family hydrolase [Gammaproteobacteria bacterium]
MNKEPKGLYIVLVSVHGLARADNLELGRDADTGGQIKYVIELAEALSQNKAVERVDLFTRQIFDSKINKTYSNPTEQINEKASIIRLPCGPRRYLRKEVLWPHLDSFIDNALQYFRKIGLTPDLIHSHYADAGYVGARLTQHLGITLFHTGHSLGRVKRQRLLEKGLKPESIENQYNLVQRIEAEEVALGNASLVIASTQQEIDEQYSQYENYHPRRMVVIPPGVDLSLFQPPKKTLNPPIKKELERFLSKPNKPMILALSRPDERKNIASLVRAFAQHPQLKQIANLVIVAGNRDDLLTMEKGPREVLLELITLIDQHDLYGSVAYPKHHDASDVPDLFQLAAKTRGLFVNPALTEPFGLTLIEAAASALPIVATEDGGPKDIIRLCKNGILIDPVDTEKMGNTIYQALTDKERWRKWSKNGVRGAQRYFSWEGHANTYLNIVRKISRSKRHTDISTSAKNRLPTIERLLVCDIDNTLLGDEKALRALLLKLKNSDYKVGFAVATGRHIESTIKVLKQNKIVTPDLLISSVGTEIHYGHRMFSDTGWHQHINYRWEPESLREAMRGLRGIKLQPKINQRTFKVSYFIDPKKAPRIHDIVKHLRKLDLHAKAIYSQGAYLDLLPIRASKGLAIRYLAEKWAISPEHILVAGDSGNDEEMLGGNTYAVVVGNYSPELERLRGKPHVYFAKEHYSAGIVEGIDQYNFLSERVGISEL